MQLRGELMDCKNGSGWTLGIAEYLMCRGRPLSSEYV